MEKSYKKSLMAHKRIKKLQESKIAENGLKKPQKGRIENATKRRNLEKTWSMVEIEKLQKVKKLQKSKIADGRKETVTRK